MWRGIDKRRFPRANYKCEVLIRRGKSEIVFSTQTENIGVGGICVILERPLDIFSEVEIELTLEKDKSVIKCKGSIVWVIKRAAYEKEKAANYDTGIEFLDLKDEDRTRIEAVVSQIISQNKK